MEVVPPLKKLFLSEVLGDSGKILDPKFLTQCEPGDCWYNMNFPKEKQPRKDMELWKLTMWKKVPIDGLPDKLGRLTDAGYKIWDWRLDTNTNRLLHFLPIGIDLYTPETNIRRTNWWERSLQDKKIPTTGDICTTREVETRHMAIRSTSPKPISQRSTQLLPWRDQRLGMHVTLGLSLYHCGWKRIGGIYRVRNPNVRDRWILH